MLPHTSGAGPRIVVADDDDLLSEVLVSALRAHGHDAVQAPSGILTPGLTANASLVILDAHIPGVDFDSVFTSLSATSIGVLVLSGEPTPPPGVSVERFLSKPVALADLLDAVTRLSPAPRSDD